MSSRGLNGENGRARTKFARFSGPATVEPVKKASELREALYLLERVRALDEIPRWVRLTWPWLARAYVWMRTRTARNAMLGGK